MSNQEGELAGFCFVDSGQIMIGDPCYLSNYVDDGDEQWDLSNKYGKYTYQGASASSLSTDGFGELGGGLAVAVSSGYGDGSYPVYIKRDDNGRIASATIIFISEEYND